MENYFLQILSRLLVRFLALENLSSGGTRIGFYERTCPRAETIIRRAVIRHNEISLDYNVLQSLLKLHFHDCFVHGCDASILLDGPDTEKTAPPNKFLTGYDVIDYAKTKLERKCPGVVSCADILAIAAQEAVTLTGGPSWAVPTGRRDGRVSKASDTLNLPNFTDSVNVQKLKFAQKGLLSRDLVALVGAHTIGMAACRYFSYRLYNFNETGRPDPSMDTSFVRYLRPFCPLGGDGSRKVFMDFSSLRKFDANFFSNIRDRRGILESDQNLWGDPYTREIAQTFLGDSGSMNFEAKFKSAMVKLGNIGVKTREDEGEIRRVCNAVN